LFYTFKYIYLHGNKKNKLTKGTAERLGSSENLKENMLAQVCVRNFVYLSEQKELCRHFFISIIIKQTNASQSSNTNKKTPAHYYYFHDREN